MTQTYRNQLFFAFLIVMIHNTVQVESSGDDEEDMDEQESPAENTDMKSGMPEESDEMSGGIPGNDEEEAKSPEIKEKPRGKGGISREKKVGSFAMGGAKGKGGGKPRHVITRNKEKQEKLTALLKKAGQMLRANKDKIIAAGKKPGKTKHKKAKASMDEEE